MKRNRIFRKKSLLLRRLIAVFLVVFLIAGMGVNLTATAQDTQDATQTAGTEMENAENSAEDTNETDDGASADEQITSENVDESEQPEDETENPVWTENPDEEAEDEETLNNEASDNKTDLAKTKKDESEDSEDELEEEEDKKVEVNSLVTDTGGATAVNGYLEYIQAYSDGNYNYNLSMITCSNGMCSRQLAYCLNVHYLLPNNKYYDDTYLDATNNDFLRVTNASKVNQSQLKNAILRCIYYGFPYNMASQNFLAQATSKYKIPNKTYRTSDGQTQNLAEQALQYATQLAIWYITDGSPNISYPPNTKLTPLYNLAYAIYRQAVADSATAPSGLEIDIYTATGIDYDGNKLTKNAQAMLATRTPTTIVNNNKTSVSGQKTWDDAGHENQRPDSITVHLYQTVLGKTTDTGKTKKVTAKDNWEYTFSDLEKYARGSEITYLVKEDNPDEHYKVTVNGMNITNTYQSTFEGSPVMPETGGAGTAPYYMTGILLIAAGLYIKKKEGTQL